MLNAVKMDFAVPTKPTSYPQLMITTVGNILLMWNEANGVVVYSSTPLVRVGRAFTGLSLNHTKDYKPYHGAIALNNPKE